MAFILGHGASAEVRHNFFVKRFCVVIRLSLFDLVFLLFGFDVVWFWFCCCLVLLLFGFDVVWFWFCCCLVVVLLLFDV